MTKSLDRYLEKETGSRRSAVSLQHIVLHLYPWPYDYFAYRSFCEQNPIIRPGERSMPIHYSGRCRSHCEIRKWRIQPGSWKTCPWKRTCLELRHPSTRAGWV